jgi:hypothetical protein
VKPIIYLRLKHKVKTAYDRGEKYFQCPLNWGSTRENHVFHNVPKSNLLCEYDRCEDLRSGSLANAQSAENLIYFAGYRNLRYGARNKEGTPFNLKFGLGVETDPELFCAMINANADAAGAKYRYLRLDQCWAKMMAEICKRYLTRFCIIALADGYAYVLNQLPDFGYYKVALSCGTLGSRMMLRVRGRPRAQGKVMRDFGAVADEVCKDTLHQGFKNGGVYVMVGSEADESASQEIVAIGGSLQAPYNQCLPLGVDDVDELPPALPSLSFREKGCLDEGGANVDSDGSDEGMKASVGDTWRIVDRHKQGLRRLLALHEVDYDNAAALEDPMFRLEEKRLGEAMLKLFNKTFGQRGRTG